MQGEFQICHLYPVFGKWLWPRERSLCLACCPRTDCKDKRWLQPPQRCRVSSLIHSRNSNCWTCGGYHEVTSVSFSTINWIIIVLRWRFLQSIDILLEMDESVRYSLPRRIHGSCTREHDRFPRGKPMLNDRCYVGHDSDLYSGGWRHHWFPDSNYYKLRWASTAISVRLPFVPSAVGMQWRSQWFSVRTLHFVWFAALSCVSDRRNARLCKLLPSQIASLQSEVFEIGTRTH